MNLSDQTANRKSQNGAFCKNIRENVLPQDDSLQQSGFMKYLTALRPWSFSASLTPVILGTVIGWKEKQTVNLLPAVLVLISVLSVHGAGNLVNTYHDFVKGIDNKESDDKTLVNNILTSDDVVRFGVVIYIIGCISFLGTLASCAARVDLLALLFFAGVSGSFFYTGMLIKITCPVRCLLGFK